MAYVPPKVIYDRLGLKLNKLTRKTWYRKNTKKSFEKLKRHNVPIKKLSKQQKQQIKAVWGKYGKDYSTHELIFSITGDFSPYYCPASLFGTHIEFALNKKKFSDAWSDKNYFDKFFPDIPLPKTIVRNIHGVLYDENYNIIDEDTAISIASKYDYVCIKPSLSSGNGLGVKKVAVDENLADILKSYNRNFLIQEIMEQHPDISNLNESSVNIIRMNTLFLNGKLSVLNSSVRIGAVGAFNDNSQTKDGLGMVIVGINDDGYLKDVGHFVCGKSVTEAPNGTKFAEVKIPNFEKAKELALSVHSQMPFVRLSAFDIAFSKEGEPIMMEYNLMGIGTTYYQIASGPLFGERTQELIDTMRKENVLS